MEFPQLGYMLYCLWAYLRFSSVSPDKCCLLVRSILQSSPPFQTYLLCFRLSISHLIWNFHSWIILITTNLTKVILTDCQFIPFPKCGQPNSHTMSLKCFKFMLRLCQYFVLSTTDNSNICLFTARGCIYLSIYTKDDIILKYAGHQWTAET